MCGMQMASISIWSCSCSYNGWRCSVDDGGARQVAVTVSASGSYSHQQITRRSMAVLISSLPFMTSVLLSDSPALARERRNKKNIPLDQYITTQDGLKYYDLVEGKGPVAEKGSTVQVHFDCLYRGITAVSSRESKLLAGNRIIAQPYEFKVGAPPGKERKREFVDNPNGLFSAQAAPKPPPAMYTIVEGMRVGGKRTVIVPAESGYGQRGMNEIPPGATFELNVELLQIVDT
ncbi:peptidyl-prolyl cis-trans isomerase FKBP18, chloroplastic [Arachis duranensis]|uniref:peptidylprolyl isomerase n=1 Tax=Arachis duranensis TaxID=130453 RepID=A0A6P4DD71_ARADU|nr:peptidyl-prolyl cis-trans isomerase FKBP18, chloroplastic [Arachis duranensis]XP_016201264.1 peptidyl-prolyl cis-trans isomerase FKBP18, chloroplastic [Arachis ipaensis]XP_025651394.1 peptidyl-prolyl cis-trans isomerase FKBP18, chloroplastic-like isoform X1 [Arachis hypogaea]XP_025698051.1 peptidyl-prolyl cis-trans isomerase FKBP18, chloroplastic-like isoform X1 [Arachis hypogaea]XP_057759533.1 peptidyl-prolyl cis-trans isomerase FKBP18, chloroplastic [Arachis stenosperma]XP_057759534.1 pep